MYFTSKRVISQQKQTEEWIVLFGFRSTHKAANFILKYSSEDRSHYRTFSFWSNVDTITESCKRNS